jgi:hypothetical protein
LDIRSGWTYSAIGTLEAIEFLLGGGECGTGHNTLQDVLGDIPELLMLLLCQKDDTGALGVEGRRHMLNCVGNDLLDASIGDWGLSLKLVVCASALNGRIEDFGGSHDTRKDLYYVDCYLKTIEKTMN